MQGVLELLIELRDIADDATPPALSPAQQKDYTIVMAAKAANAMAEMKLPPIGAKLGASVAAMRALRGPPLTDIAQLARETEAETVPPIQILGRTDKAITEVHAWFAEQIPSG